ncbi:MAG: amidohydrolase [Spirochaetes bacterium]|nr:amidohydrolase [Spirochaetota bacterium]
MMMIDFHVHAFPDFLAKRAMDQLSYFSRPFHDGTIKGLFHSMDEAGIDCSVVQSIATRPDQSDNILQWSLQIKGDRIEPFISIHPETENYISLLKKARTKGIKGVKVHPHYQGFQSDDENLFGLYEAFCALDFIVFFHSGEDLAFPGMDNASVRRMAKVLEKFPQMKMVLAHMGAFREWEEVYRLLAGKDVYFETSFILEEGGKDLFLDIMEKHDDKKVLFGTDSPWCHQKKAVECIRNLNLPQETQERIFFKNALNLLKGA